MESTRNTIPYEAEILAFLTEVFRASWMDDDDWKSFLTEVFAQSGFSIQSLSDNIQQGIDNGSPIEKQFEYLRNHFSRIKTW